MAAKRPKDEVEFDLARIRKVKRLLKRAFRGLEEIERDVVKFRKDRQPKPTDEAKAIAVETYRACGAEPDGHDHFPEDPVGGWDE